VNLIYQCWTGPMRSGVSASRKSIEAYAARIGAKYRFDQDPNIAGKVCDVPMYFEWLNPLLDTSFDYYDKVAVLDCDVYAVEGLCQYIFDIPVGDVGICTEPDQPRFRKTATGPINSANDEAWASACKALYGVSLPRADAGLKVYNAGVVMFTRDGIRRARDLFVPFQKYIDDMRNAGLPRFYTVDQNYFHAMMCKHLWYCELDNGWNSYIHYTGDAKQNPRPVNDSRTADTKLVHIQLRGADDFDEAKLWRITNRPRDEWKI
jgi:hypothetical protein